VKLREILATSLLKDGVLNQLEAVWSFLWVDLNHKFEHEEHVLRKMLRDLG